MSTNENNNKPTFSVIDSSSGSTSSKNSTSSVKLASIGREKEVISTTKPVNKNIIKHSLGKGVIVLLAQDPEENYNDIVTLQDLVLLDLRKNNLIVGFEPPIFHEFIDKAKQSILSNIVVGDKVIIKSKFKEKDSNTPKIVEELYFKSLNDMTVIIAVLSDKQHYLYNRLELCK